MTELPISAYQLWCVVEGENGGRETILSYERDDANIDAPHSIGQVDELVDTDHLHPLWKADCCGTKFMAKPEEAAFCPGCGAALYDDVTGSDRELIDAMGRDDLEVGTE